MYPTGSRHLLGIQNKKTHIVSLTRGMELVNLVLNLDVTTLHYIIVLIFST